MGTDDIADRVGFDAEGALAAAREAVGSADVLTCTVYDDEAFETIYVDERIDALYPDEAARSKNYADIHAYVYLDFLEGQLFEDLFVEAGRVEAFVTYMEDAIAVRVVRGREGAFFVLAPGTPVTELVESVREAMTS